jgi:hypothetical protein
MRVFYQEKEKRLFAAYLCAFGWRFKFNLFQNRTSSKKKRPEKSERPGSF